MKIVYIDPHCSGLQTLSDTDEKIMTKKLIENKLKHVGMDEDTCSGEVIYYIGIQDDGIIKGRLDYT